MLRPTFPSIRHIKARYFSRIHSTGNFQLQNTLKSTYVQHNRYDRYTLLTSGQFYFSLFLLYALVAAAWGWLCYKHKEELLPIQVSLCFTEQFVAHSDIFKYYLSSLVAFLVIEMVANWGNCLLHAGRLLSLTSSHQRIIDILMPTAEGQHQQSSYSLVRTLIN